MFLKLTCKVEFDVFKVHLRHLKYITGVCQEHIAPFSILRHILVFTFLESFQFCGIIAFLPNKPYKGLLVPNDRTHCIHSTNDTE